MPESGVSSPSEKVGKQRQMQVWGWKWTITVFKGFSSQLSFFSLPTTHQALKLPCSQPSSRKEPEMKGVLWTLWSLKPVATRPV